MPALEALQDRLRAAHTTACGISIDTTFSHAAWAEQLGGVSFPLVSDFHPKGELAEAFGVYLGDDGICDRATVIVDAAGTVHHCASVTPAGKRDAEALVKVCEDLDAGWSESLPDAVAPRGLPPGVRLYVKDRCMFSRWALYARTNLHLQDALPVVNVSRDPEALAELERLGGKGQAPALYIDDRIVYESAEIATLLAERASWS
ncbi:redoxin domain-containing protein [Paraliomyxa miuraensis]|uniref:redoxin domain-containing protein n=1 Tax=Paraliomyxa miuraensis TaxID=376150 RepID=UPI0022531EF7|nr:redoxin domain-containing protein [Paraliomyxa miuraensis]MCX4241381.1 redoxin domain-containing protein [Paraliomyxa miuraensis]